MDEMLSYPFLLIFFVWFKVFLKGPCHTWVVVLMPLEKEFVIGLCN
jgi:hypothetical protein